MTKLIKVFGAALDANDSPLKILAKCSYINRLAQNLIDPKDNFKDPYEGLLKFSEILKDERFKKVGKFSIVSWLTPKPEIEDFPSLDPAKYQALTNSGEIYNYSKMLETWVEKEILPEVPLMVGADHSMTGGVIRALSNKYSPENILLVIFDAHFDGIPASISLNLAKFASENKEEVNILSPYQAEPQDLEALEIKDNYTCASFLNYLIEEGIVLAKNIIIFGNQDYPSERMQLEEDKRVKEYVEYYLSFEKKGVKFIPSVDNENQMLNQLSEILKKTNIPYLYISLDVDVSMFKEVLAARFTNAIGIEKRVVTSAVLELKKYMDSKNCKLIGLDIMEIETYMLNKDLPKSGEKDKTIELIDEFLEILI